MRRGFTGIALLVLAGCSPAIPDSGAGVGFGDYNSYIKNSAAREAQLNSAAIADPLPPAQAISDETYETAAIVPPISASTPEAQIAAETQAALAATARNSGVPPVEASPSNVAPTIVAAPASGNLAAVNTVAVSAAPGANRTRLSDENDFSAVDARRSIETDAERMARNRAQYQVIQPTALPERRPDAGPNLVEYALSTTNVRGQSLYRRVGISLDSRSQRSCAKYPSPDLAQSDFLKEGGPQRDRLNLDPDGDGFACAWNPAPFRQARGG